MESREPVHRLVDVDLSERGMEEARAAGRILREQVSHSMSPIPPSETRDPDALDDARTDGPDVDPHPSFLALNERHYGALQGLNKAEMAARYGEQQVHLWRRATMSLRLPHDNRSDVSRHDPRYRGVAPSDLPLAEC